MSGTGHWRSQKERGAAWAIAFLLWTAKHLGRRVARFVTFFPVVWFFLTGSRARAAVRDYLGRVRPSKPARLIDVWRQFWCFGLCALDRIFLLAEHSGYQIRENGADMVVNTVQNGGALLMAAHFGSFEAMRVQGSRHADLPIAILMDRAVGPMLTAALERLAPKLARNVIDASDGGPQLVLKLKEALAEGKLVGIMVDRARVGEATVAVEFLGAPAHFPTSPWQLAMALKCPVILGFSVYRGAGIYDTHFELFSSALDVPRGARAAALEASVQTYAHRLAHWVRQAPDNWFNFYPFWAAPKS